MKKILQTIKKNETFLLSTHVNPDPDALSSELVLDIYLRSLGKKVFIVNEEKVQDRLDFLPGGKRIRGFKKNLTIDYDVAIVVDCGDLNRIGKVQNLIQSDKVLINIDHHITNDKFGSLNLVVPDASSTAEVLYDFLKTAHFQMTKNAALLLYAGILTDTGSFRYANTTHKTHLIAGELRKFPFSADDLYRQLYETMPLNDVKEFTKLISRFDAIYLGKVVCLELRKRVLARFSGNIDLRDMIFKFLRAIKGVEVCVIFTEVNSKETRINFRSMGDFNVAKLASNFNGGGHRRASGGRMDAGISETRKAVLKKIGKAL